MDEKWKKEEGHLNLNQQETHQQLKAKKEEEKKWIWTSRLDDEKGPLGRCPKTAFPIGNGAEREGMNASRSSTPQGPEEVNIKSKKEEDPLRDLMKAGNDQIRDWNRGRDQASIAEDRDLKKRWRIPPWLKRMVSKEEKGYRNSESSTSLPHLDLGNWKLHPSHWVWIRVPQRLAIKQKWMVSGGRTDPPYSVVRS